MPSKNTIRASVVQAATAAYSLPDTLDKLEKFTRQAAQDGSQLAVFPEAFIGGYPMYSNFGIALGYQAPESRDEIIRYYSAAIDVPNSDAVSRMEAISRETGVFLVVGVVERDLGTLYCTVVFIDPAQGYIAKHRKLVPASMERIIWGQGDGTTLPVLDTSFVAPGDGHTVNAKVSATICWENFMPLLRTFYYSKGTQIYCAPTIDSHRGWQNTVHHIAVEGRCFVLCASQYSEEKDYPDGHAVADDAHRSPSNVMIGGGSVIVSPLGKTLAGPLRGQEGVLTADLDLDDIVHGKFDLDVTGHYARPDVFDFKLVSRA